MENELLTCVVQLLNTIHDQNWEFVFHSGLSLLTSKWKPTIIYNIITNLMKEPDPTLDILERALY